MILCLLLLRPPDPVVATVPPVSRGFGSSIAFYELIGHTQKLTSDLRGDFWEWQLPAFAGDYSVFYLSDGPCTLLREQKCLVLPANRVSYVDQKCCVRTSESWRHFVGTQGDKKWYFRGTHDTFVNMTLLLEMIQGFERRMDPMREFMFAFNFHEYDRAYYPHGGTGWLFSSFAVHQFFGRVALFDSACDMSIGDDVYMPKFFREFGLKVEDYQTNQFIVTFPNTQLDVIFNKQFHRVAPCPAGYSLYWGSKPLVPGFVRRAASIHMHKVPMNLAHRVVQETPEDFAVTFPNPNLPTFCRRTK
jgi:hypothetical protein